MEPCPGCGRPVDEVHPVPPEVITKELLEGFATVDSLAELETCSVCLDNLLQAGTIT